MIKKLHSYKVGQYLKLRKYSFAKTTGLARQVYNEMIPLRRACGVGDYDPDAPSYEYFRVIETTHDRFSGIDLITLKTRGIKCSGSRWEEYDLSGSNETWLLGLNSGPFRGYDEIVVISDEDARAVIDQHQSKLDDSVSRTREQAETYRAQTEPMLRSL